jgi:ParB family chromosome partitioning protein
MGYQRLAGLGAEAGDDVEHALREAGLGDEVREGQRRGRCELRRLDHHGIAGSERRRELPGQQQQRRVPRDDHAAHAERFVQRVGEGVGLVDRQHRALDLVGKAAEIVVPLRRVAQLQAHLGDQLAVVADLDPGEPLGVLRDEVAEPAQQVPALGRIQRRPVAVLEGPLRRRDGAVHVLRPAARHQRPGLAGIGVEGLERFARGRRHRLPVDVHREFLEFGHTILPALSCHRPFGILTAAARLGKAVGTGAAMRR